MTKKTLPWLIATPALLALMVSEAIYLWLFPGPMCAQPDCEFVGGPNKCMSAKDIAAARRSQEGK